MWIIVGLGNPGRKYEDTRHNVGFITADELADRLGCTFKRSNDYLFAEGFIGTEKVVLVKPLTFMNLSGRAVLGAMEYFKCGHDRLVVIHDDLDVAAGRIKIRPGGGDAGHKGVRSVIESIGAVDFLRVKIGIGRPEAGSVEGYVLSGFGKNEREQMRSAVSRAADAIEMTVSEGHAKAMSIYNAADDDRSA